MKYRFTLLLIFLASLYCNAQTVPSSCSAPDSVLQMYRRDAQGLALQRIIRFNSPYADSVLIPDQWTDSILRAMVAVYNATILTARDSVAKYYQIHSYLSDLSLKGHDIAVDKAVSWVADIKSGTFPTHNDSVNKLMLKYGLHEKSYSEIPGDPLIYIYFTSDSNCNVRGLDSAWNKIYPIEVYLSLHGDGSEIFVDTITSTYVQLDYRYSCGDCPSGCTANRHWQFKIYNDCSVEYLGSKGDKIEGMDCIQLLAPPVVKTQSTIYPNPFSNQLIIKGINKRTAYIISNALGQVCLSGSIDSNDFINTGSLNAGIYFIKLMDGNTITVSKMLKAE
ncbi:MAG: T9SS type A sorting domain-containing protein [Flavipsychrobacter sp.]